MSFLKHYKIQTGKHRYVNPDEVVKRIYNPFDISEVEMHKSVQLPENLKKHFNDQGVTKKVVDVISVVS